MHVGFVAQRDNERAIALAGEVREALRGEGVAVTVDPNTSAALGLDTAGGTDFEPCDLVVSIGGDGTFLFAARNAGSTPILGVNLGEVGFLNAVTPAEAEAEITDLVATARRSGSVPARERPRVVATGDDWQLAPAVNEVVIQGPDRGRGGGLAVSVTVDGRTYEETWADGVIVATPTGSTAYNLSEGGPLVHPDVDALVVSDMCGVEANPSLVVDPDDAVTISVSDAEYAVAVTDGRMSERVATPGRVTVRRAAEPLRIAGPELDFYGALSKLD
jgi:NAD+ kinase